MEANVIAAFAEAGIEGSYKDFADPEMVTCIKDGYSKEVGDLKPGMRFPSSHSALQDVSHEPFDKAKLYIEGPIHCLVEFARNKINQPFKEFMTATFGTEKYREAPVKTATRIYNKVQADLFEDNKELWE